MEDVGRRSLANQTADSGNHDSQGSSYKLYEERGIEAEFIWFNVVNIEDEDFKGVSSEHVLDTAHTQ